MLTLDPAQRISAKDALDAEYFWTDPLPCNSKSLPKYESSQEFQTKKSTSFIVSIASDECIGYANETCMAVKRAPSILMWHSRMFVGNSLPKYESSHEFHMKKRQRQY
ncbi:hypothetical protein AgCh_009176 [Apium graveolens]